MGTEIKRNRKGLYQLKSTVSDEKLNDGWITEDEVKKILIEKAYFDFVEKAIRIDMEFPFGYHVNDKLQFGKENEHIAGGKFLIENWNKEDAIENKFREICKRLNIEL